MKIDKEFTWSDVWVGEGYILSCSTTVRILLLNLDLKFIFFVFTDIIKEKIPVP